MQVLDSQAPLAVTHDAAPVIRDTKTRPILFSAPMVRALLSGTKTQTRRAMKVQPDDQWSPAHYGDLHGELTPDKVIGWGAVDDDGQYGYHCPYGKPGERLWVRESLGYCSEYGHYFAADRTFLCSVFDDEAKQTGYSYECAMREASVPSIHLPRRWARITLRITDVRVERLQDITAKDIIAEGSVERPHTDNFGRTPVSRFDGKVYLDLQSLWACGWQSINGAGSWAANPWVWVVSFARV